jgi:cyclopropane fatty-acyl-phospholipid synthase-like methyltransferase
MSTDLPHSDLNTLHDRLLEEIPPGSSVLDVGAGLATYHPRLIDRGCKLTLIDAHKPYLDERLSRWPQIETINEKAENALWDAEVTSRRWDMVLGIDFVEHLTSSNARYVIEHMKVVAPKVILFVPEGDHPQEKDHYNLGGDHWQTHRSTWYAEDLEHLGFTVERWLDFHRWAKDRGCDPGALWATWRRP